MEKATIGHNPSWNSRDDSVGSGASGASSEGDNTNTTSTDRLGESSVYANESSQIHRTKVCFGLLATLAGAAVCFIIYFFIVKLDYDRFNLEYVAHMADIVDLVQWEVTYNFALVQQLSATITSMAITSGTSFPNFTVPFFEISAGYVDGMGGIMTAAYAPIISPDQRSQWEEYSSLHQNWIQESEETEVNHPSHKNPLKDTIQDHEQDRRRTLQARNPITPKIFHWEDGVKVIEPSIPNEDLLPLWQVSPPDSTPVNLNLLADPMIANVFSVMASTNQTLQSGSMDVNDMFDFAFDETEKNRKTDGHAIIMTPVFDQFGSGQSMVGIVIALTSLENLLSRVIPPSVRGIYAVFEDSCGDVRTYKLNAVGRLAKQLGLGDLHETDYESYKISAAIKDYEKLVDGLCLHTLNLYPSLEFRQQFNSKRSALYKCLAVAAAFAAMLSLVAIYDNQVTQRQRKTMQSAKKSGELLDSLFPKNVRERMLDQSNEHDPNEEAESKEKSRPIADFFPNTSLMFADIAGFTAWSSTREPFQVFELLETIYSEFDAIAKRRRVFKVETVGDCYVAAVGLPTNRKDHAVTMARFARDCLNKMNELLPVLEVTLGPETSTLSFRVGIHSGPVTAGVLRANNARYQIFGDTVNTAARMETTGVPNRIQVSGATADLIIKAGKGHWVQPREEAVFAKGKGEMETYWLVVESDKGNDETTSCSSINFDEHIMEAEVSTDMDDLPELSSKLLRLVDWNTEVLMKLLKKVVARRTKTSEGSSDTRTDHWSRAASQGQTVLSEVQEIIRLPGYSARSDAENTRKVHLDEEIQRQLRSYVAVIASHYPVENPFHNFEHASHVALSVVKMMSRIVSPADIEDESQLHNLTHGITSDPLVQFACVFSALIHDVDHPGVPNGQLTKENSELAAKYHGKSVAEQRSVDLSWSILLGPKYEKLRKTICTTEAEINRFRKLVVNSVMATDVMDRDLKELRNHRWSKAFDMAPRRDSNPNDQAHRKATIVIEHLIQASDISHTMQHWHIYRKWNEHLFSEMYKAYLEGRSEKDPTESWHQGEIGFFDFYVIPLAKKLRECGVFGVSSQEYLSYAEANRREWELKGQEIVEEMAKAIRPRYRTKSTRTLRRLSSRMLAKQPSKQELMESSLTRTIRRLSSSDPQKQSSSGPQKQSSKRELTRQPSVRTRPNALARSSRTASMRSLMEKVWQATDVLDGPAEIAYTTNPMHLDSKGSQEELSPENAFGEERDTPGPLKRSVSKEDMLFT